MSEMSIESVREQAHHSLREEHEREPIHRTVAVLIMIVTLLAAVAAYLQTQAGTREAEADREAQHASVATMAALVQSNQNFNAQYETSSTSNDLGWARYYLSQVQGRSAAYATRLSNAYGEAGTFLAGRINRLFGPRFVGKNGDFDYNRFYLAERRAEFEPPAVQKAAALTRGAWAAKRARYIAVITIFAVALFLLGLTLTAPPRARAPFLVIGCVVAGAAAIWGVVVFLGSVPKPSEAAIDHYVEGVALIDQATERLSGDEKVEGIEEAIHEFTRAIESDSNVPGVYLERGEAYFDLDLARHPEGPKGSKAAIADLEHAVGLDPQDYTAWGDLGAAKYWLGDYEGALEGVRKAVQLQQGDPFAELNLAEGYAVTGHEREYRRQLTRLRALFRGLPSWRRDDLLATYSDEVTLTLDRPKIVHQVARFLDDVYTIGHQIDVANSLYGKPQPPRTDVKLTPLRFELARDRSTLAVSFDYSRATPADTIFYRTYVNGVKNAEHSRPPQTFKRLGLDTPDSGATLTIPRTGGWRAGQQVRIELYVDGNLLAGRTYIVPSMEDTAG